MRTVLYILQKEFIQIFRDKAMLPMIVFIPVFQLLVLSYTATFEIKHIRLEVVDQDHSSLSRKLINKFSASPFYRFLGEAPAYSVAENALAAGKADQVLVIAPRFEKDLFSEGKANVRVVTDAINGSAASLMSAYAVSIIRKFNENIVVRQFPGRHKGLPVQVSSLFWYNPELNYITYMVPGILVLLITIIALFLSSMNIAKEKELGTIEQLNVTPIHKLQFIAGKLIPFWLIAMVDLVIGLLLARFWFGIIVVGSPALLLVVAAVYLLLVLSLGLFVSSMTETMQQAMFISWFILVIFILMSGLFTPIESMPLWAQHLDKLNPLAYFVKINRMIMLKGAAFSDFYRDFFVLTGYTVVMLFFSVLKYRKTSG